MTRAELPERIETERLVLRVRTVADAEDIHAYASLQKSLTQQAFRPSRPWKTRDLLSRAYPSRSQSKKIFQLVAALWSKEPIGSLALLTSTIATKTMCWRLAIPCTPDYWGRGYVPEAVRTLIDLAFKELGLHKVGIVLLYFPNVQSQRSC